MKKQELWSNILCPIPRDFETYLSVLWALSREPWSCGKKASPKTCSKPAVPELLLESCHSAMSNQIIEHSCEFSKEASHCISVWFTLPLPPFNQLPLKITYSWGKYRAEVPTLQLCQPFEVGQANTENETAPHLVFCWSNCCSFAGEKYFRKYKL